MLLIALAFLAGPDLLHEGPHVTVAAATAAEREHRATDDLDTTESVTDHLALTRRRVPGLPASQQQGSTATGSARLAAALLPTPPGPAVDGHLWRHLTGCSPESLQVFRC